MTPREHSGSTCAILGGHLGVPLGGSLRGASGDPLRGPSGVPSESMFGGTVGGASGGTSGDTQRPLRSHSRGNQGVLRESTPGGMLADIVIFGGSEGACSRDVRRHGDCCSGQREHAGGNELTLSHGLKGPRGQ